MPRGIPKAGFRNRSGKVESYQVQKAVPAPETRETDEQIVEKLAQRFDIIDLMSKSACKGQTRALIVSGPPGLGKSFTVEQALREYDPNEEKTVIAKGFMRASGLYKLLYNYRHPGNVIVFDDCDSILFDQDALNLVKAACDTTDKRRICWGAETRMTDDEGAPLPWGFEFEGAIVFITNVDFEHAIAQGSRSKEHFEAMISRAHYIDTGMKSVRDYLIRIKQVCQQGMLRDRGISQFEERIILDFLFENHLKLRELTLRMVIKLAGVYQANPQRWREIAKVTLFKQ